MVDLTLFLLTWNVKDTGPDNGYGDLLNYAFSSSNGTKEPELIAIGLQEVSFKILGPEPWVTRTKEILAERDYVMVKKNQLVGILLMVLVKRQSLLDFTNIKTDYTRTGLGGLWGNKGAVSTRFDHKGVSIVITNSHLAAHDYNLETRITEFKKIYGGQSFEIKNPDYRTMSIGDHDLSLWLGDLNFRLDDLTGQEILQKIVTADLTKDSNERKNLLTELLDHDQLSNSMRLGKVFVGYTEDPINFSPTYKFVAWSNEYDLGRKPAWCDRILYKDKGSINLETNDYRSHPDFSQSDHKPVSNFFSLNLPKRLKREISPSKIKFIIPTDWKIHHDSSAFYTFDTPDINSRQTHSSPRENTPDRESNLQTGINRRRRSASRDKTTKLSEFDWIGLYPANFTDIEEPITFVWANPESIPKQNTSTIRQERSTLSASFDPMASTSSTDSSDSVRGPSSSSAPIFRVDFSELVLLKPGQFRLLYFNEDGQLLAISDPFSIHR